MMMMLETFARVSYRKQYHEQNSIIMRSGFGPPPARAAKR